MSTVIMSKCWPVQVPKGLGSLPGVIKNVLVSLADNANDQGYCWPSIETICKRTCFERNAVINAIKILETVGLLVADRSNGRHTTYIIVVPDDIEKRFEDLKNQLVAQTSLPDKPVGHTNKPVCPRTKPVCQTNTNRHNRKEPSLEEKEKKSSYAHPCNKIVAEQIKNKFNEILTDLPDIKLMKKERETAIRCRWDDLSEAYTVDKNNTESMLAAFNSFFHYVHESDFLNGRNGKNTKFGFDWIFKQANFIKIIEGNYENKEVNA